MMTKTTQSILLAALMATAGFASAQTTSNPTPAQGGPTVQTPADAGTMPNSRAQVKGEVDNKSGAKVAAPAQGGNTVTGGAMPAGSGGMSATSRADVKAQVNNGNKAGASAQGDNTTSGSSKPMAASTTSAERKAARAERKAARKAKRDAASASSGKGMDSGPSSPAKTAPQ